MTPGPGWADPFGDEDIESKSGTVQAALLTTYDPPDSSLLVEDLLPRWFQLDRELSPDDSANRLFLAELATELMRRQGRLSIFSSSALLGEDSRHWIWSHISRHFVGALGSVVQHAKLWLLHRLDTNGSERLEIHISSTNLTRSAVREQIQAGFRCIVPLGSKGAESALRSWGSLVPFLKELGLHSGPCGSAAVEPWLRLLAKCQCPTGVVFVASVPGTHRGVDWGVRALGAALCLPPRSEVDILVPTVGFWTKEQVELWARAVGTLPKRVRLGWIPKGHSWAMRWALPATSASELNNAGVNLLALGRDNGDERQRLHRHFIDRDDRWPHAKAYWFQRGAAPRVLITSANWSTSAWGASISNERLHIRNFEIGVLLSAKKRPFRTLKRMTAAPAVVDIVREVEGAVPWAHATFDGRKLVVQVARENVMPDHISVIDVHDRRVRLRVRWKLAEGLIQTVTRRTWKTVPAVVVLVLNSASHWLSVQDLRDPEVASEDPLSLPPGIDDEELARLRAALLEERYGGKRVESPVPPGEPPRAGLPSTLLANDGKYSVWIIEEARRVLSVIDNWAVSLEKVRSNDLREILTCDGRQLLKFWQKEIDEGNRRKVALVVACDELQLRLGNRR